MKKKTIIAIAVLLVLVALAACSSLKLPGTTSAQAASNTQGQQRNNFDPSKMTVEQKLAIGTLKLQDTPNAITADEAKNLLPLWKAVKSLGASNTSSADEVTALYKQIEDTMTPAQIDAIKTMTWTQTDMTALFQKYGIQQGNFGNLTADQRATRVAQFQQNNGNRTGGNGGGGGVFVGGGGFPGGGGGFPGGGGTGQNGQNATQRTPVPGGSGRRAGGLNMMLADPIIKMLQTLAGA